MNRNLVRLSHELYDLAEFSRRTSSYCQSLGQMPGLTEGQAQQLRKVLEGITTQICAVGHEIQMLQSAIVVRQSPATSQALQEAEEVVAPSPTDSRLPIPNDDGSFTVPAAVVAEIAAQFQAEESWPVSGRPGPTPARRQPSQCETDQRGPGRPVFQPFPLRRSDAWESGARS